MKRPPKLVRICVFLLLGAIVNVTVAWFFACWPGRWDHHFPPQPSLAQRRLEAMGFALRRHQPERRGHGLRTIIAYADATNPPRLMKLHAREAGWPLFALSNEWHSVGRTQILHGGWELKGGPPAQSLVLPVRPLWPGFAINTVFYAAVLWLLFAAASALRRWRRIKRGLCPKCAYDLRGRATESDACPECGDGGRGGAGGDGAGSAPG
jgi:hypothetical protein